MRTLLHYLFISFIICSTASTYAQNVKVGVNLNSISKLTRVIDKKCSTSRLATSDSYRNEKREFTSVKDPIEDKHNAEVGLFLQTLNSKHSVNEIPDFGRNQHTTVHSTPTETDCTIEEVKLHYFINDYGFNPDAIATSPPTVL